MMPVAGRSGCMGRVLARDHPNMRRVREAVDPAGDRPLGLVVRAVQRYLDDNMAERAPGIAYYGILSLFPALLLAFAAVRFIAGDSAPADIASYTQEHGASGAVAGALRSAAETAQKASAPTAGGAGLAGLLTLIYGASRAFTALGRAVDAIGRRTRRSRTIWRRAQDITWTLVLLGIAILAALLVSVSGAVLEDFLELIGIGGAAVTVWTIARWPVAAALTLLIVALVRWAAPTGKRRPFRLVSPGRLVTVGSLAVTTAGFNVYVTYLASYNATYGAFTAAIILMLWIWMAGSSILYGAELDAVLVERAAARAGDQPSTSPTSRARATASERDEASSLR
jgi:membrane protein